MPSETERHAVSVARVRLIHISDVHLPMSAGLSVRHWNVKRALGHANWQRKRRFVHTRDALDRLVAHAHLQAPDHWLVSGDLVNLGLPEELAAATAWLGELGAPDQVSVVPGNHDIYCVLWRDAGVRRWAAHMASSSAEQLGERLSAVGAQAAAFPYVRRLGGAVALIGLNSAHPTPPGYAGGRLGAGQLNRLGPMLDAARAAGLFRLIMIHHPPLPFQAGPRRALRDAGDLADVIRRHGAELVVHGHNHRTMAARWATRDGTAIVHGVPSASQMAARRGHDDAGAYRCYEISDDDGRWIARWRLIGFEAGDDGAEIRVRDEGEITWPVAGTVAMAE